jgi:hypothetical protein
MPMGAGLPNALNGCAPAQMLTGSRSRRPPLVSLLIGEGRRRAYFGSQLDHNHPEPRCRKALQGLGALLRQARGLRARLRRVLAGDANGNYTADVIAVEHFRIAAWRWARKWVDRLVTADHSHRATRASAQLLQEVIEATLVVPRCYRLAYAPPAGTPDDGGALLSVGEVRQLAAPFRDSPGPGGEAAAEWREKVARLLVLPEDPLRYFLEPRELTKLLKGTWRRLRALPGRDRPVIPPDDVSPSGALRALDEVVRWCESHEPGNGALPGTAPGGLPGSQRDVWREQKALPGEGGAPLPLEETPQSPPIVFHSTRQYSIGGGPIYLVNETEDNVLQAFRESPVFDEPELIETSGVDHAPKVLRRLKGKYNKEFACAIETPRRKASGGFRVNIRRNDAPRPS